jgi:hypothetical protein
VHSQMVYVHAGDPHDASETFAERGYANSVPPRLSSKNWDQNLKHRGCYCCTLGPIKDDLMRLFLFLSVPEALFTIGAKEHWTHKDGRVHAKMRSR